MEIDPICGMEVDTATAKHTSQHEGKTYYFCAPGCKRTFDKDPAEYTKSGGPQTHGGHH
jgi:YHS domain-containing protein